MWKSIGMSDRLPRLLASKSWFSSCFLDDLVYTIYIYIFPLVSRSGFESSTASVDLIASAHTDWTVLDSIVRLDSARFGSLRGIRSGNSFSDWSLHIRSDNTGCQSLADFHTCIPPLLFARIGVDDRILGCSNMLLYSC